MDAIKNIQERLNRMEQLMQRSSLNSKKVLTFEEAALYTGRSRSNLHKLTSSGAIPHSKPLGKMIYFDRNLLDEWMLQKPRKTTAEIEEEAATYVVTNPPTTPRARKRRKNSK